MLLIYLINFSLNFFVKNSIFWLLKEAKLNIVCYNIPNNKRLGFMIKGIFYFIFIFLISQSFLFSKDLKKVTIQLSWFD